MQAVLENWAVASGKADDIRVLRKSYDALPSDAHRRMFLDAALLHHDWPAHHLTATWAAQLALDDEMSGGANALRGLGWRSRGRADQTSSWQQRADLQRSQCSDRTLVMLDQLVKSSLVQLVEDINRPHSGGSR